MYEYKGQVKAVWEAAPQWQPKRKITNSQDAADFFRQIWEDGTIELYESAYIMFLSRANEPIGWKRISEGGRASTIIDVSKIHQAALLCNASSIIMCHNHPSGNLQQSQADEKITKQVKDAGRLLDIQLLDHIILTADGFFSFADKHIL